MDHSRCGFEKIYIAFTEIDASNRFSLTVAITKNKVSQNKNQAISTLKEQLFGESMFWKSPLQVQMFTIALLKKFLYLMNSCNYCCEIAN